MDFVSAVQGLMEWLEDLECINTDVPQLCVYISALQILPNWLGNMVNLHSPQYFRAAMLGFYSHFKLYLAIFT